MFIEIKMPFFVVATPIGNLADISERAISTLKEVDLILAEDTRNTKKLLNHFKIKTPLMSYHQHSKLDKIKRVKDKNIALVSDAGTPGISDPGNEYGLSVQTDRTTVNNAIPAHPVRVKCD